jgi:hypothetical protein
MLTKEHVQSRKELQIRAERVDDIVLLIGMMVRMGLPQVLDTHILVQTFNPIRISPQF